MDHRTRSGRQRKHVQSWLFRVLLVFTIAIGPLTVPVVADSVREEVSITLGETPIENGIKARAGDYEAGLQTGVLDGKSYWKTNKNASAPGTLYLYMNVDDNFLYDNQDQTVYVTVEYFDKGNGSMVLQYDAESAPFKDAPLFTYTDTNQWKSHTYKLSDAKFANRTNGSDFRIGIEGAGVPANNPDLYIASVRVTKQDRLNVTSEAKVIQTLYPTKDIVIANFNAAEFGAKGDGVTDDTEAIQNALDAAGNYGGGVVFVPAGQYKVAGNLFVPTGVTLRGDWAAPDTVGGVQGTVLLAYAGRGDATGTSFVKLEQSSGMTNLSIWYPEQTVDQVTPYPWTIEQLTGDNATVENVTLVNSYNGIKIGPVWNELHYIKNVYGTTLKTGIFLDYTTDIGRLEGVNLSPDVWSGSGLPGAPARTALFAYMTSNAEGVVMGRSDWEYMSDIQISGYQTGMRITTRTGSLETANAQLYNIRIDQTNVALRIEGVNNYGLLISNSYFKANVGHEPKAIYATSGFRSIAQFNTVTVGGNPHHAVVNEGTGVLSFENSVIENWNSSSGGYAIRAAAGSLILGQTQMSKPEQHLLLETGVQKVTATNSGHAGNLDVTDASTASDIQIHQDDRYQMKAMPTTTAVDVAVQPKPASDYLYDVTAAPYSADRTGSADVSAVVKQALADAAATGGTVYFPAGIYRIEEPFTVPSGVEIRGSWDVPHHTIGGGSVIFTNYGEHAPEATPFITLESNAGIRGLSVYYDKQDWSAIKPYAWTVQGKGRGVYVIHTTLVNAYQGVDFGSYDTSGHYIDYLAGSPLKEGVVLGGGSSGGYVRNIQFNPHYYSRNRYPNHVPGNQQDLVWNYQKENLDAIRIGHSTDLTIFNTFVYGSEYGIHFVAEDGYGPEAVIIGHGTDGSKKGVSLEAAGPSGLTFINTELVSMSTSDKVYVVVEEEFDGEAIFFNTSMWGDPTRAVDIFSGKLNLQQVNFTVVGERGVSAHGGDVTLYNSYFQQPGVTHIYAGPGITRMAMAANLSKGDLKVDNQSSGKLMGPDLIPISLRVAGSVIDPAHPEKLTTTLVLTNESEPQGIRGKIEVVQPSGYQEQMIPIRFESIGPGGQQMIKIPFIAIDAVIFKVTLDDGRSYLTTSQVGQTAAAHRNSGEAGIPSVIVDRADQYVSLGGTWQGPSDLSAQADVTWDETNLYLAVMVQDDHHYQAWMGGDIWQGDSIQVGIDLSRDQGKASQNVNELGFALGNDGTVAKWRWRAPAGVSTGNFNAAQVEITRENGMTIYHLTIPFASLHSPEISYTPGDPIGFSFLMNEHDGSGRTGFMEYNRGIGTSKDATLFGDLYMLDTSYTALLEGAAEWAVAEARQHRDVTRIDAAYAFVNFLPDGEVKSRLKGQLDEMDRPLDGRFVLLLDKKELWPANHKLVPIHAELQYDGDWNDVARVELTSITSNEPIGIEDIDDASLGEADYDFELRASRLGSGEDRTYTIVYTITMTSGEQTTANATVTVPHDQGKTAQ